MLSSSLLALSLRHVCPDLACPAPCQGHARLKVALHHAQRHACWHMPATIACLQLHVLNCPLQVFLLVGFNEKAQFADVGMAAAALAPYMLAAQERCAGSVSVLCVQVE